MFCLNQLPKLDIFQSFIKSRNPLSLSLECSIHPVQWPLQSALRKSARYGFPLLVLLAASSIYKLTLKEDSLKLKQKPQWQVLLVLNAGSDSKAERLHYMLVVTKLIKSWFIFSTKKSYLLILNTIYPALIPRMNIYVEWWAQHYQIGFCSMFFRAAAIIQPHYSGIQFLFLLSKFAVFTQKFIMAFLFWILFFSFLEKRIIFILYLRMNRKL